MISSLEMNRRLFNQMMETGSSFGPDEQRAIQCTVECLRLLASDSADEKAVHAVLLDGICNGSEFIPKVEWNRRAKRTPVLTLRDDLWELDKLFACTDIPSQRILFWPSSRDFERQGSSREVELRFDGFDLECQFGDEPTVADVWQPNLKVADVGLKSCWGSRRTMFLSRETIRRYLPDEVLVGAALKVATAFSSAPAETPCLFHPCGLSLLGQTERWRRVVETVRP